MDAQMAIAIFTALAAFAALRTVKITRQSISVDALLRLDAYFNSPDMKATRKKAASFCRDYGSILVVFCLTSRTNVTLPLMTF